MLYKMDQERIQEKPYQEYCESKKVTFLYNMEEIIKIEEEFHSIFKDSSINLKKPLLYADKFEEHVKKIQEFQ